MLQDVVRVLILVLLAWVVYRRFFGKITGQKARELVSSGALLLDVRSPSEFAGGHVDSAKNIPVGELVARAAELGTDHARPVVVYCASGMRSASAKSTLKKLGFSSVFDLGGMGRW
jgi:rhodanese-related sulfurtransferase